MKTTLLKKDLATVFLLFIISLSLFAQESIQVSGVISTDKTPIPDINIQIEGKAIGTKTDAKGFYSIKAEVGDKLLFTHVSFESVNIIVEDVTSELNLNLEQRINRLKETVVIARKKLDRDALFEEKMDVDLATPYGTINPKKSGFAIAHIDGEKLNKSAPTIEDALNGKSAGLIKVGDVLKIRPDSALRDASAIYFVDGLQIESFAINLADIEDIYIVKNKAWVIINTKNSVITKKGKRKAITEQYRNQNYYSNDALKINKEGFHSSAYTKTLEAFNDKDEAYSYFEENLKNTIKDFDIHISIAQKFSSFYNDRSNAINILNDLAVKYQKNSEVLKATAYNLQAINAKTDALTIYKTIAKLRPKYAQSYRDLANAYKENNESKMSWRVYMNYLMTRNIEKVSAIDNIVYNEMEYIHYNRQDQTDIKEQFIPNSESKSKFINDVRFVVEWNTSEAEFDLELVSPDKRAYVFEHTLSENQDLITNEKLKGFTSEEFFINDIGLGEWLVNLTYYGNKKSAPTYFKLTTYYHWGKTEQRQEVAVYKLEETEQKMQLLRVNEASLITLD